MNALDIFLLILLVPAVVRGFMKGFLVQAFELTALVAAAWIAYHFSWTATGWVTKYIQASPALLHILLFVLILIAAFYLLNALGIALRNILRVVLTGWIDKLLGMVFGLLKAGLVTGLLIIVFQALNAKFGFVSAQTLDESTLYGPMRDLTYAVFPYFKDMLSSL